MTNSTPNRHSSSMTRLLPLLLASLAVAASSLSWAEVVVPKDVSYRARDLEQAPIELVKISFFTPAVRQARMTHSVP